MKNRVFLINFPEPVERDALTFRYYDIQYHETIEEFILCSATAIFYYDAKAEDRKKNHHFFKPINFIDESQLLEIYKNPREFLDKYVGRKRLPNPRQFEVIPGSVVRSKVDPRLGAGVVKEINYNNILVTFPKAKNYYDDEQVICHPSTLRVVTHIKELQNEHA